ncbi:MAG: tRNA (adenosine(37)-N6)-threonylcarbamoyltransferase complex ATPase subunit type 1 TsaE [Bryobacteraceae bacterium]|nr:tRNA (adenosine(37)-N6)-threonylcarbamoyltransferase complex ATPase subunit type 1 TsaE [Bryobacterales bacterium]MEB2362644.1 tRNA (adenosine(37)-N6)-threonylcarbamoyltransferase complex ATPase subunit type 1 TsaE [Bryobacterales bacterium]NUN01088.1 tRNA (adenosine(37)-N6)-threonylcarbamoyltransferase complex ATPase subunit type 1 TsaE [Bryobacteraceae bacterium]
MSAHIYRTESEEETIALGREIARDLPQCCVVLLIGNLGAGKTTLAKGIVEGLGAASAEDVASPTFTLIHEYSGSVYHVDLYRLDNAGQVAALGLEEILEGEAVTLLEWGERFPEMMPDKRVEIRIARTGDDTREFRIDWLGLTPCPRTTA